MKDSTQTGQILQPNNTEQYMQTSLYLIASYKNLLFGPRLLHLLH